MNTDDRVLQVPIEDIIPNRFQPRLAFDDASLQELAASIKQHGIIQPLVLRRVGEKYEIIAGERRYKAATMAGLTAVPAVIKQMDDRTSAEVAIVENVQRKDLTAIEEARSYKALLDKGYINQEDLAKKMGLSQSAISNKLRLLNLDEAVQDAILKSEISERHARSLLKIKEPEEQKKMLSRIISERLTVRQLEEEIKKMNGDENEVPLVNSTPDMNSIIQNATDITSPQAQEDFMNPQPQAPQQPINPNSLFTNNTEVPNKFFNFLEDESANMTFDEQPQTFTSPFQLEPNPTVESPASEATSDDIELLDFSDAPTPNNDSVNEIINRVRGLNLDPNRVSLEEMNLPDEYYITIKIKKNIN